MSLTSVISLAKNVITFLEVPPKTIDEFVAALFCPVYDWNHGWEELISPSLEIINNSGPLSKNKDGNYDDMPTITAGDFEVNRFKKQLISLFDRISKLSTSSTSVSSQSSDISNEKPSVDTKHYNAGDNNIDDDDHAKFVITNNDESTTVAIKQKANEFGRNSVVNNDFTTTTTMTTNKTTTSAIDDDALEIQTNFEELNKNYEMNEETSDWMNDVSLANAILKF